MAYTISYAGDEDTLLRAYVLALYERDTNHTWNVRVETEQGFFEGPVVDIQGDGDFFVRADDGTHFVSVSDVWEFEVL